MDELLYSFKTMIHQLTQVRMMVHAAEKIKIQQMAFRQMIQFDGDFSPYASDQVVSAALYNNSLLICSSILDEFSTEFTANKHPEFADRIIKFRGQVKPILKRIGQWKDLKVYRNQIIAHNLRINGRSLFGQNSKSLKYKTPSSKKEVQLLVELLTLITMNIAAEFPELTDRLDLNEQISDKIALDLTDIDINREFKEVSDAISKLGLTRTHRTPLL